jgi:hypothetical protein
MQSSDSGRGDAPQAQSPTFVAQFADGEVTRMSVFSQPSKLAIGRGVRLAQHAYRSRTRKKRGSIVGARFEQDGAVLAEYTAEQLAEVVL